MLESPISINHTYGQTRNGRRYLVPKGKVYKKKLAEKAQKLTSAPTKASCTMEITYYFGDKRRRDVTNYDKPILDAISGIIYEDDCQVSDIVLRKRYDKENPRTEIKIWRKLW